MKIIFILAIGLAVIGFYRWLRGNLTLPGNVAGLWSNLPASVTNNQELFKDIGALMAGFLFLDVALAMSGWLPGMFAGWGLLHLLIYPLGLLALAFGNSRTGRIQKAVLTMTVVAFAIFGLSHLWTPKSPEEVKLDKELKLVEASHKLASTNPVCNQRKVAYRFETAEPAEPFNSAGQCAPDLWHDGHCLWIRQAGNTAPLKHCSGQMPPDIESAWSADTAFTGFVKLSPPRYVSLFR